MAKGFTQKEGIYFEETFVPMAKINTFNLLLAIVAHFVSKRKKHLVSALKKELCVLMKNP